MPRWLFGLVVLCLGALAASDAPAQQGETRIALIIANADYISGQLVDLPGAQHDATAISAALEHAGFSRQNIVIERNLDIAGMRRAFSSFGARLTALGQNGLGFIYYAGHGIADSDGEGARNYIIPTDANLNSAFDYPNAAYSVSGLLDGLNRTRARTVVVVLDACRRTPLRGDRGMVPEIVPRNMLVAYSASPGQAASDDGTYARRLAEELVRPNADITQVFTQVQYRVSADSRGSQTPRVDIGLTAPVVFVAAGAPTTVATLPVTSPPRATAPPPAVLASTTRRPGDVDQQELVFRQRLGGTGVGVTRVSDVQILLNFPVDFVFDFNRDSVKSQFAVVMGEITDVLRDYPQSTVEIYGHADSQESESQALSERRAMNAASLIVRGGVTTQRVTVTGFAASRPIADNSTEGGRARNRRVEIFVNASRR